MLTTIHPKLPMCDKTITKGFYVNKLEFQEIADYNDYLIVRKDNIEIHFFLFEGLNPHENYGQVYIRTDNIDQFYQSISDKKLRTCWEIIFGSEVRFAEALLEYLPNTAS